jgi:hypothetical protein
MANEPERPIEKLLRAAAKKRRDECGAPLELHPATRRLLQGEVTRKFARPGGERRSFAEMLVQLWPRFAGGAAIFAVLALAVYVLEPGAGPSSQEALLASNKAMPPADETRQFLSPPSAAVAMTPAAPAPVPEATPQTLAFADKPLPVRPSPAGRLGTEQEALAKDSILAPQEPAARERLAFATAPQVADKKEPAARMLAVSGGAVAQAPAGAMNGGLERRYGLVNGPVPPAGMPPAPAPSAPVASPPVAVKIMAADESTKLAVAKSGQAGSAYKSIAEVASANRKKPASTATDGLLKYAAEARSGAKPGSITQSFARVAPEAKAKAALADKAAPAHPVLAAFQVEQAGSALRIVDGDGSVYSGYVQIATAARRQRSTKAESSAATRAPQALGAVLEERPAASLDSDQLAQPAYFFRVAGTNRSLNKKVVFTGNLMAATNLVLWQPVTNNLQFGGGVGGFQESGPQPGLLPFLHSRISGKVVIGNGKAVEINAIPTSR